MENIERFRLLLEEFGIEYYQEINCEDLDKIQNEGNWTGDYSTIGREISVMSTNKGIESKDPYWAMVWLFDKNGKFQKLKMER